MYLIPVGAFIAVWTPDDVFAIFGNGEKYENNMMRAEQQPHIS
jgi:hypothetical protein